MEAAGDQPEVRAQERRLTLKPKEFSRMFRKLRALAVGLVVVVGGLVVAVPAHAAVPPANLWFNYRNLNTPKFCLDVEGGDPVDGARILVWTCNGTLSQRWVARPDAVISNVPYFRIKNAGDQTKCLSVAADSRADGAQLVIWGCKTTAFADQLWSFKNGSLNPVCTMFTNFNSGKVMGVRAGSRVEGTPVVQWGPTRNPDQEWDSGSTCANPNS